MTKAGYASFLRAKFAGEPKIAEEYVRRLMLVPEERWEEQWDLLRENAPADLQAWLTRRYRESRSAERIGRA